MDTIVDHLVTRNIPSDLPLIDGFPSPVSPKENPLNTSSEELILDLSQRPIINRNMTIDNWHQNITHVYTDSIDDDFHNITLIPNSNDRPLKIEQSFTDQFLEKRSSSDTFDSHHQSTIDRCCSKKKQTNTSSRRVIHELQPGFIGSSSSSSSFLWSTYFSLVRERSISGEFFDHYLASIQSSFETDMKLEYCYDIERDLYWLTQIQLVAHRLLRLHFVGIAEDDTSNDFWADIHGGRCHPIGWCRDNSKLMLPPPVLLTKRTATEQVTRTENENPSTIIKEENDDASQTPPAYLFDQDIGLTPAEQLKKGMLLELQDIDRPWLVWFVRIINNRGGRLHVRYITNVNLEEDGLDRHLFYLDRRIHFIGWTSTNPSIYSYDVPSCVNITSDKEMIIEMCVKESLKQFHCPNLFREQEEVVKHRFTEGMKLEVFEDKSQNIYTGKIGTIHNEYYFDVLIDNEDENHVASFVSYSTHPHILPAHWANEHKLALMKGKGVRQSDDYWNSHTEQNGMNDLAPERCFNLITLNATGTNRVEAGMKMEMIYTLNNEDLVFSVTLIHVADHLMWVRIDDTTLFKDESLFYHVLPINSLDVFPVGWAKFNGFRLITPLQYHMEIKTYEENRYDLFSTVTHYPRIPRVYLKEIYLLTIYVNIRCFCGPHFCSSRLARIPSQFGPGPYDHVLIDMFHHLLSTLSANAHRSLRRLDHQSVSNMKTEHVKSAKRSSKLIRPISLPTEPRLVHHYLRHICTQLEACPNLFSIKRYENNCPEKCHILANTFAFSTHSKSKRTQLRAAKNRYRKQKSLLCHLKDLPAPPELSSPVVEELPTLNDPSQSAPASDRQTRGFRVHIEPKTHRVTRMNRKQKLVNTDEISTTTIKQEPVEIDHLTSSPTITTTVDVPPIKESKRTRIPNKKRSSSPSITSNILSSSSIPTKNKKKRDALPTSQLLNTPVTKIEMQPTPLLPSSTSTLIRSAQYSIPPPPIDPRNPVTWNVNDVCWYLNESGCSFALKTIKEQEIDGAALLLLDDLNTVQDVLEFKLGPAVKFCHVVEQLRTQVIDRFHSSPSLKTSSRLSTT